MILDNLYTTRVAYENMDERLSKAFDWLRSTDLKSLTPDTKVVIDGERVFAQVQSYDTIKPETGDFETHRSYIDIQVVVTGTETIMWTPLAKLTAVKTPYDFGRDLVFFEEPDFQVALPMNEGDFTVLFPTDGHKPRCQNGGVSKVLKIVVKIAV